MNISSKNLTIKQLKDRLNKLIEQKKLIDNDIFTLKKEIEKLSPFSKSEKILLFRELFIGRVDVYAKYWVSKDGTKKGYSPDTYTFRGKDYISISNTIIQRHLEGKIRLGSYVVINGQFTKYLVLDLDKKSFIEDARAIDRVCKELDIYPLYEISKSGNGIHIWIFFDKLVKAYSARKLGDLLITKAMDSSIGIDMNSYDRMFPNQDFVPKDSLGNLIAMPLHFGSRSENKTVFIDINSLKPFENQWDVLQNIKKVNAIKLDSLTSEFKENSLMPWDFKRDVVISFPNTINIVLYDKIYIEKNNLSKALLNKLKKFASFSNPEFFIRQKLRKSIYNTPRVITQYELNEKYIIMPRGLKQKIISYFAENRVKVLIEDKRHLESIKKPKMSLKLRQEQKEALRTILNQDYALLIAPPGFGKTAVACATIEKRAVKTLILTHKTTLLNQWLDRLSGYFNLDLKTIGKLGGGKKRITNYIDVATLQSLKNRVELIEEYSYVIIDEAHHIPAVSYNIPLKMFRGKYILGLSATPIRKDGMHPIMKMQCGEIAYEVSYKSSKKHQLKSINTQFETIEDNFALILNEIVEDSRRNLLIIDEIKTHLHRKILVISERVEHLNTLHRMLLDENIKSILIHGSLSNKTQKDSLAKIDAANIIFSTSSYIGEGIDIPHLDTIIITMPISFSGRIIQYLGRVGRDGQECLAIDFVDNKVAMLKSSFNKRLSGYKKMGYSHSVEVCSGLF